MTVVKAEEKNRENGNSSHLNEYSPPLKSGANPFL